jgi:antitoxin HigA-1
MMIQKTQNITQNRPERPVHPGEVIADILEDLEISSSEFAEILGVSHQIVNDIIQGIQPITVDLAIRIGKALGNGPGLWLNLQQKVDVWNAWPIHQDDYNKIVT